jgi:hypothetical protein
MLTVHLRINDAATGRPTPVRLRVTGPDGTYYAPLGRVADFATGRNEAVGGSLRVGREKFAYIDGACEIRLPAGVPLRVQATKGPEYEPLVETVRLGSGQMALRFGVRRWADVRAEGWVAGDTRVHFLDAHTAALEAAAEGVAVVNLLACVQPVPSLDGTIYPSIPNITAFSGQRPALQTEHALVAVNTLNVHPVLGSVGLLNCHRPVYPLAFGGPEEPDDWSVCDWCDQCHRKNGLTVWVNPFEPTGGEALVALLLGKIDAIEYDGRPRKQPLLPWWYRLLNAGFGVPLVGGSGKDSNTVPLGTPRTYAKLLPDEPLSYGAWVNAVRAGRCFVTNGPLVTLDVGQRVRAAARCLSPFKLELVADGQVIAAAEAAGSQFEAAIECDLPSAGWVAARCIGNAQFAHSAPVYLADRTRLKRAEALAPLRAQVEQTRDWIEQHGRFGDAKWRRHLLELCNEALGRLAP